MLVLLIISTRFLKSNYKFIMVKLDMLAVIVRRENACWCHVLNKICIFSNVSLSFWHDDKLHFLDYYSI